MPAQRTRRTVLAGLVAAIAGGGGEQGATTATSTPPMSNPAIGDVQQRGDLRLTSTAFDNGGRIPDRYGRDGENVNPPLSVGMVPDEATTLALIVDDPDAVPVGGEVFLHWLVWNVPASRTDIPAGWTPGTATVGENDFGNRRYDGPAPPDREHTYRFKCYALRSALNVPAAASKEEVGAAMRTEVLSQTQLTGRFAP